MRQNPDAGTRGTFRRMYLPAKLASAALTAILFYAGSVFGQSAARLGGTVSGPDHTGLAAATVVLQSRDGGIYRSAGTDPGGVYDFTGVAPGDYLLEAAAPEFERKAAIAVSLSPGETRSLDVELPLARLKSEIVVTASTTPLTVEEVSKALDVVDAAQIESRDEFSIPEALRTVPGIRVKQQGGPGNNTSIQIRGMRTMDTALVIDGFRFRDAADINGSGAGFFEDLTVVDSDRVEVLRGSGSSLYGTNATGGVINIVTSRGGGSPHSLIKAEGGGLGFLRGLARIGGGAAGGRLLYSGGISHVNVLTGLDGADQYRNSSGQGWLQYRFNSTTSLSGRVFAADAFNRLNDSPFTPFDLAVSGDGPVTARPVPLALQRRIEAGEFVDYGNANYVPDPNDPDARRSSSFFTGAIALTKRIGESGSLRFAYSGVDTNRRFDDGPGGISFEPAFNDMSRFDGRIDTIEARGDAALGRHNLLTFGYEFEREAFDNPARNEDPDPFSHVDVRLETAQRSHALFAQNQLRLADGRFQFSLAGRLQSFDLSVPKFTGGGSPYKGSPLPSPQTAYTGDAALSYFFAGAGTKLRTHAGNSYRAPSLFERYGSSFFFGSFSAFGDPRLRPERTLAFDAGIDQWLAGQRVRISATYFYTALQEIIVFDSSGVVVPETDPYGRFGGYWNTGGGTARGAEFGVTAAPTRTLDLSSAYTYTNSDQRTSNVAGQPFFKSFDVSDHMFTLTALQRVGRRLEFAFDFFVASGYAHPFFTSTGTRAYLFDGPVKSDLVVNYRLPVGAGHSLKLFGKLDNVLNQAYFEDGFRSPGIWGTAGLAYEF